MSTAYANLLSESEKWEFDLHGYLYLRGVIDPGRLQEMLEVINPWLTIDAEAVPEPVVRHRCAVAVVDEERAVVDAVEEVDHLVLGERAAVFGAVVVQQPVQVAELRIPAHRTA